MPIRVKITPGRPRQFAKLINVFTSVRNLFGNVQHCPVPEAFGGT
ncbi:hypothetical protein JOH51_001631 [Rhizobium leguminosarum]|nr:hypothetical protein [Rhizobium leguminosarum]